MARRYYFDKGFGDFGPGEEPDVEAMVAYLLDEDVLFVSFGGDSGSTTLMILCNDYFVPAADAENLPHNDIPNLFDAYIQEGWGGVYEYIANKRFIPNRHWTEAQSAFRSK